jgi:3-dehydroquinate synthase
VVKYGVIWDASFFHFLEKNVDGIVKRDPVLVEQVVARCCEIKAEVVAMDEREIGPRAILNFGHTLGHAIEKVDGYGRWLHGEAVSLGMQFAARLSTRLEEFPVEEADRMVRLQKRFGLPLCSALGGTVKWTDVREAMLADKKTVKKTLRFVLAKGLGDVVTGCEVEDGAMMEVWDVCGK